MKTRKHLTVRLPHLHMPFSLPAFLGDWRSWLPSRGNVLFTLLVVAGLLWGANAGALPAGRVASSALQVSTSTIPYQGRLADSAGNPLTGAFNMIFRLYDTPSGGTPLWEEQWSASNAVQVSDGLFNVMLGSLNPISTDLIASHNQLWLGITVGTDDEMQPRIKLGSVPFAIQALTVPDGSITSAKLNLTEGLTVTGDISLDGILRGPTAHWADYRPYIRFLKEQGVTAADLCPEGGVPVGVTGPLQSLSLRTGDDLAQATYPEGGTCVNVHSIAPCGSIIEDRYPNDAELCTEDFSGKWAPFYWWDGSPVSGVTYDILSGGVGCWSVRYACVTVSTPPTNCITPPSGLVSWWPGDGNADDIIDGNTGVLVNGVTFATGVVGQGFSFDGVDDRVRVAASPSLNIVGDVTVDLWAKRASFTGQTQMLISKGAGSGAGGVDLPTSYNIHFASDNTITAGFERADGSNAFVTGPAITDTGFHHYAYVRSGNTHQLYVDGVLVASDTFTGSPGSTADIDLLIGGVRGAANSAGSLFNGIIDEVEIFNRALSASEIQAIFAAGSDGKCKP